MCRDALAREESCGGHFREEHSMDGEAKRDDANFSHVAAWQYQGPDAVPIRHQEQLKFEFVTPSIRSYSE